ncbi:MAG TPA: hypothetical protein VEA99_14825, partial [Gemmatimonadaceae bacterium]|nr:hypothetical protein [Gemmatimonadaceae bacterium]
MTQHPPRRRAIGTSLWTLLAALAAPLASPAQPALTNASPLESPIPASRATFAVPGAEAPRAPRATPTDTLVFAHAALRRSQIELVPALERMGAASDDQVIAQPMLAGVTAELRRTRSR